MHFHTPYIQYLQDQSCEVHTAASGENAIENVDRHFEINFSRSPLGLSNIAAYHKLKKIISREKYDIIHCHTPVASVMTRLAARRSRRSGTIVIYTAHGFHFFEGNSAAKNFIFRRIEKFASKYTDCIITINNEDYEAIERFGFKTRCRFLTYGVGIDGSRFKPVDPDIKLERRRAMGIKSDDFVIIYPAEYSIRKNQAALLRAIAYLKEKHNIVVLLPGEGKEKDNLGNLADELGIHTNIKLMGRRSDIDYLLTISDLSVAPSRQEGLPTHIIEAMATGLPCIASRIRGHMDLVEDGVNGFLFDLEKPEDLADKITKISLDPQLAFKMRENSIRKAQVYMLENTVREMADIYGKFL